MYAMAAYVFQIKCHKVRDTRARNRIKANEDYICTAWLQNSSMNGGLYCYLHWQREIGKYYSNLVRFGQWNEPLFIYMYNYSCMFIRFVVLFSVLPFMTPSITDSCRELNKQILSVPDTWQRTNCLTKCRSEVWYPCSQTWYGGVSSKSLHWNWCENAL